MISLPIPKVNELELQRKLSKYYGSPSWIYKYQWIYGLLLFRLNKIMAYIEKPINKKKLLSIVIPVFNSEKTISRIYERVTKSFKNSQRLLDFNNI